MRIKRLIATIVISAAVGALVALGLANVRLARSPLSISASVSASRTKSAPEEPATPAPQSATIAPAVAAGQAPAVVSSDRDDPLLVALAGKWPLALLLALVLIAFSSRLRRIFGAGSKLVRKVSAGGVEMEISSEAVDQVRAQLKGSFRELVASARDEYERMSDLQEVDLRLEAVVEKHIRTTFLNAKGMRATVHVPDIIFKDYLYQLLDYYPKGDGAHRRFSQRYGIIGRSWRSQESHGTGAAFASAQGSEKALVKLWGMTRREAHGKLNEKPSCLSVLLRSGQALVGVLYVDSDDRDAFGVTKEAMKLVKALEKEELVLELAAAIERTLAPLRAAAPNLDINKLG